MIANVIRSSFFGSPRSLTTMSSLQEPIKSAITEILKETLEPVHLEVINESHMHNVPKHSETHFKILVVSTKFEDLPLIKRHRMVYNIVSKELGEKFPHALAMETKTPTQWSEQYKVESSPACRGGFGK